MTKAFAQFRSRCAALGRDRSGAAAVEYALVFPVFILFLIGSLEIGYRLYANSVVNGALREAARMASTGAYTGDEIDTKVRTSIESFRDAADIDIEKRSYSDFTGVGLPEPITSGTRESGTYCYQDINGNSQWDSDRGEDGLGGAEDVIYYEVTLRYPLLIPLAGSFFGLPATQVLTENTIVSNEPFAAVVRAPAAVRCVSP